MSNIQFYEAGKDNKIHGISHKYAKQKQYTMQLADIITKLNVVSSQATAQIDKTAITKVNIGSNISAIGPSCFIGCTSLQEAKTYDKLKVIDREAFYGCSSLTSFGAFCTQPIPKVYIIEQSAFANTGLVDISVSLSGTSTATYISPYAFAGCKHLKSVTNVGSNFLADYEFAGCTALTSVKMPNSHSFSGEYAFKDCISLKSIEIPASTFKLNNGLFYGCTALTSVKFNEPSQLKFANCIGNLVLSGAQLTSLTLPASIKSYAYLSPYSLVGLDKLKEIHFNGMTTSQLGQIHEEAKFDFDFKSGFIYTSEKTLRKYGVFGNDKKLHNDAYKYEDYVIDVSEEECKQIANACIQAHIPLIAVRGNLDGDCGHCVQFANYCENTAKFLDWVKSDQNKYIIISSTTWKLPPLKSGGTYPYLDVYWAEEKEDKSIVKHHFQCEDARQTLINQRTTLIDVIEQTLSSFAGTSSSYSQIISVDIMQTHCFGLNHDVLLYGNDDPTTAFEYKDTGGGGVPSIIYNQTIQVDHITTDDFRYGQWYFNAKELKAFADKNHIPVFFEFGSKNCGPCDDFLAKVFNNSSFQKLLADKCLLLCKVTSNSDFSSGQEDFIANRWVPIPLRPEGVMPVLGVYWNQGDIAVDSEGSAQNSTYLAVAHYNNEESKSYPACPLLTDLESTITWLNRAFEDSGINSSYTPKLGLYRPDIVNKTENEDYPRYKMYDNQENDDYGRYFPVMNLVPVKSYDSYTISVDNDDGVLAEYTFDGSLHAASLPPYGTYQYFTALSTPQTSATYNTTYDLSGVIFKVGYDKENTLYKSRSFGYGTKKVDALMSELGLAKKTDGSYTNVNKQTSYFYDNAYTIDYSSTPPTPSLDPEYFDSPSQAYYNGKSIYYVDDTAYDGKPLTKLMIEVSSDVACVEDADNPGQYEVQPIGDIYAISAYFYTTDQNEKALKWLSVFYNFDTSEVILD